MYYNNIKDLYKIILKHNAKYKLINDIVMFSICKYYRESSHNGEINEYIINKEIKWAVE